jgi:hypothetical protein
MTAYQIVSVGLFLAFLVIFSCFLSQKKHEIFWRPLKPLLREGCRGGVFNESMHVCVIVDAIAETRSGGGLQGIESGGPGAQTAQI